MKTIQADEITKVVSELCKKACYQVTPDMRAAFEKARENETSPIGKDILGKLLQNADLAAKEVAPICQDTGMTVVLSNSVRTCTSRADIWRMLSTQASRTAT